MHFASTMTVRREQGSMDVAARRPHPAPRLARTKAPAVGAQAARWRKMLPGAILLTALVALGGLFPFLF
jgi:hypothetical protein